MDNHNSQFNNYYTQLRQELPCSYIQEALNLGYHGFHRWWYSFVDKGRTDLWVDILVRLQLPGTYDYMEYNKDKESSQQPDTRSYDRFVSTGTSHMVRWSTVSDKEKKLAKLCEPNTPINTSKQSRDQRQYIQNATFYFEPKSLCILRYRFPEDTSQAGKMAAYADMLNNLPKGITYSQKNKRYIIRFRHHGQRQYLGKFDNVYDALVEYVKYFNNYFFKKGISKKSIETVQSEYGISVSDITAPDDV